MSDQNQSPLSKFRRSSQACASPESTGSRLSDELDAFADSLAELSALIVAGRASDEQLLALVEAMNEGLAQVEPAFHRMRETLRPFRSDHVFEDREGW